jgi:hypothetical protein
MNYIRIPKNIYLLQISHNNIFIYKKKTLPPEQDSLNLFHDFWDKLTKLIVFPQQFYFFFSFLIFVLNMFLNLNFSSSNFLLYQF